MSNLFSLIALLFQFVFSFVPLLVIILIVVNVRRAQKERQEAHERRLRRRNTTQSQALHTTNPTPQRAQHQNSVTRQNASRQTRSTQSTSNQSFLGQLKKEFQEAAVAEQRKHKPQRHNDTSRQRNNQSFNEQRSQQERKKQLSNQQRTQQERTKQRLLAEQKARQLQHDMNTHAQTLATMSEKIAKNTAIRVEPVHYLPKTQKQLVQAVIYKEILDKPVGLRE